MTHLDPRAVRDLLREIEWSVPCDGSLWLACPSCCQIQYEQSYVGRKPKVTEKEHAEDCALARVLRAAEEACASETVTVRGVPAEAKRREIPIEYEEVPND